MGNMFQLVDAQWNFIFRTLRHIARHPEWNLLLTIIILRDVY